jgi:hypothetical protein
MAIVKGYVLVGGYFTSSHYSAPNTVCTGRFATRGAAFKGIKARASDTNRLAAQHIVGRKPCKRKENSMATIYCKSEDEKAVISLRGKAPKMDYMIQEGYTQIDVKEFRRIKARILRHLGKRQPQSYSEHTRN